MSQGRVLVVEDDLGTAEALRTLLEDEGYTVRLAGDGREALEVIAAFQPNLVLMDLMMPTMDGLETCRALRAEDSTRHIPVVLMTVSVRYMPETDVVYDGVLAKPFELEELLGMVAGTIAASPRNA